MPLMTVLEYAKHRGCTKAAVYQNIRRNIIEKTASNKIDSEAADSKWKNPKREFITTFQKQPRFPEGSDAQKEAINFFMPKKKEEKEEQEEEQEEQEEEQDLTPTTEIRPFYFRNKKDSVDTRSHDEKEGVEFGTEPEEENLMQRYMKAKIYREETTAEATRTKLDILKRDLIPKQEFIERMEKLISIARSKILSIPSSIKTNLPHLSNADIKQIENSIRDCLRQLSES